MMSDDELRLKLLALVPKDKIHDPDEHVYYAHTLYCWVTRRPMQERSLPDKPSWWQRFLRSLTQK